MKRCTDPAKEETFLGNRAVQIENALPLKAVMSSSLGFLKYILRIHWVDRSNRWQVRLNAPFPNFPYYKIKTISLVIIVSTV